MLGEITEEQSYYSIELNNEYRIQELIKERVKIDKEIIEIKKSIKT